MLVRMLVLLAALAVWTGPLGARVAAADDEDGTPPLDGFLEARAYTHASTRAVLGQFAYLVGEVDRFPAEPSPRFVDENNLRKRLLDLRLIMDFNAFAYEQGSIDRHRDLIDTAYEAVGQYKDLYEIHEKLGLAIEPADRDRRFNAMLNAVAPWRQADVREKFEKAYGRDRKEPVALEFDRRPRLWQLARVEPTDGLDSAGNAARLGRSVLLNLRADGLLVADIMDPAQEERFHDIRKALRSVLVLTDMFPSLSDAVADVRAPLADLVKAYGKANDQIVAYRLVQGRGQDLEERRSALAKAFEKAQGQARAFDEAGQLDAFAGALEAAEAAHRE